MNPIFNICNIKNCDVRIKDRTLETVEYIPEEVVDNLQTYYVNNRFKYSLTYTINIILYKNEDLVEVTYTDHSGHLDEAYCKIDKDGWYSITHIILPSLEWLDELLETTQTPLENKLDIYVTDGKSVYRYFRGDLTEVDPLVLLRNPEGTTISSAFENTFSICRLYKCYIDICKQIFNTPFDKCSSTVDSLLIFKRDFLWMTINVIKYYIEFDNLEEALRLLEKINYCGQFCNDVRNNIIKSGCGCSQTKHN